MPRDALTFDNDAIAKVLDEIADLLELKGENVFRAVTYRAAARSIRDLREPLAELIEQKRLKEIPKVGRLRQLPKIQTKTEENILKSIAALRQRTGRALLNEARAAANTMLAWLRQETGLELLAIAGSLRRFRETIGDVDIV